MAYIEEKQRKASEEPSLNAQILERSYVCQGRGKKYLRTVGRPDTCDLR